MGAIRVVEAHPPTQESVLSRKMPPVAAENRRQRHVASLPLWIVQGALALIFVFAGGMKLALPGVFVRVIGVCEILGAIGLILPGLLRIRVELTSLAATGLVLIMIGATTFTLAVGQGVAALLPLTVGLLASFVAYGRWLTIRTLF